MGMAFSQRSTCADFVCLSGSETVIRFRSDPILGLGGISKIGPCCVCVGLDEFVEVFLCQSDSKIPSKRSIFIVQLSSSTVCQCKLAMWRIWECLCCVNAVYMCLQSK